MSVPDIVIKALNGKVAINRAILAIDHVCEGSIHHSPIPLMVRRVGLVPWAGNESDAVWLCGICADNLSVLQTLYKQDNGDVPWRVRRQFGNAIRALADRGWALFVAGPGSLPEEKP